MAASLLKTLNDLHIMGQPEGARGARREAPALTEEALALVHLGRDRRGGFKMRRLAPRTQTNKGNL